MKKLLYIIICVIVLVFVSISCENKSITSKLDDFDTLMRVSPDSVYAILDSMDTQQMSKSQRMRHALLLADAQNKAYIDFTTDSVMLTVADYYDHHGTPNEQMRAHYLLGCTYRDLNDVPMELQCFQEAVEKADTTAKDCDLYTLAAIYGQIANIYHYQFLPEEELKSLAMCEKLAKKEGDTFSAIKAYELRLRAYNILNMPDSVLSISETARAQYLSIGKTVEASLLLAPAIGILIDQERYDEAYEYMELFENTPVYKDSLGNVNHKYAIHLYYKGRYELYLGRIAEAKYCFYKLMEFGEAEASYNGLLSLYKKTNQLDSLGKYASLYAQANDSNYVSMNSEFIEQMTASYNYSRHEQIAKQKTIESANAKNLVYIISMIAILLFFAALTLYIYLKNKNKERERVYLMQEKTLLKRYNETKEIIAKLEQEKTSLENQKEEVTAASKLRTEELLLTIDNYEKEKEELVMKLKGFNQINEDLDFKAWYENLIACDATNKLHAKTIVTPNMIVTIDNKIWDELRAQLKRYCPAFLTIIDSYSLNPTYQHIVLLNTFDFSTSEISVLLNKTVQQISNIHNRISKKIFPSSNETRKLKHNLQEILRNKRYKKS